MSATTLEAPTGPGPADRAVPHGPAHVPAPAARLAAVVAVVALLLGVLTLPGGPLRAAAGFASLVDGPLEVHVDGGWRAVAVGETIGEAARLRAAGAAVTLDADGGRLVLAAGVRALVDGGRLAVERGSVLVDDPEPRTLVVDGVQAVGRGTWRVDAGPQPRLATYRGDVSASDGSDEVALSGFEQLAVRDRAVGGTPASPLRYSDTDRFDRDELGEAFRVDELATAFGRSLASTYGDAPRGAGFFADFVAGDAGLERHLSALAPITTGDDRFGPPAEVLIGVTVAEAVAALGGVAFDDAAEQVGSLRGRGASWGLVLVAAAGGADAFNAAADRVLDEAAAAPAPATGGGAAAAGGVAPGAGAAAAGSDDAPTDEPRSRGGAPGDDRDDRDGRDDRDRQDGRDDRDGDDPVAPLPQPPAPGDDPVAPLPPPPSPGDALDPITDPIDEGGDDLEDTVADLVDETTEAVDDVSRTVDDLLTPSVDGPVGGN